MIYNKLFAAIASVLIMRWLMRWSGIDIAALGVEDHFRVAVELVTDAAAASVSGFFVWLVPNVKKKLSAMWVGVKAWGWPWAS